MAVAFKGAGTGVGTETSGANCNPTCPATVDAGDILIAHVYFEGTTTAPTDPGGIWSNLSGPHVVETTIGRHWVYGAIAAGTEDGSAVSFGTAAVTTMRCARIYSFSGRTSGTITQLAKDFAATSHATDPQMPTVATTVAGALAVALVLQNDNNALAAATGETGGDWTEATAEAVFALTPGAVLQLQTCTPTANPGTVTGGAVAATNDPSGVVGFQILAAPATTIIESDGSSTGSATTTGVGAAIWASVGASTPSAATTGVGAALALTEGASTASATTTGEGATVLGTDGASTAAATVDGIGEFSWAVDRGIITRLSPSATPTRPYGSFARTAIIETEGSAAGSATTTGIGAYYVLTEGASNGIATVDGAANMLWQTEGASVASSLTTGIAATIVAAVGSSTGSASVSGSGEDSATPAATAQIDYSYRRTGRR